MTEGLIWHHLGAGEVLASLGSGREGLSEAEAKKRLAELPRLKKPRATSAFKILMNQFVSPFMLILAVAVALSAFSSEWQDAVLIIFIVLFNVTLGFFQEYRADRALFALAQLLPRTAVVRRSGVLMTVAAEDVVPGDIMHLTSGDKIVADARVLSASNCLTNEAPLTGESEPVEKSSHHVKSEASIVEQTCMMFAGTVVVAGKAQVVVVAVGEQTAFGKIAQLVFGAAKMDTPLTGELKRFSRRITIFIALIAVAVFILGIARGEPMVSMLTLAAALAVAAVPEGLTVALTVIFVAAMRRMAKRGALMRRMVAAETLGAVTVMCMDKTGTLTTGEMKVELFDGDDESLNVLSALLKLEDGHSSPLEKAGQAYLIERNIDVQAAEVIHELPFDSKRKFSAVVSKANNEETLCVMGAPDILFEHLDLYPDALEKLKTTHKELMSKGLRVLLLAKKSWHGEKLNVEAVQDLEPLGFLSLRDPLRVEAKHVVANALLAGVRTVMVTGDHEDTARGIAAALGLSIHAGAVVSHAELATLDDRQLLKRINSIRVFARVLPEDKVRIVKIFQQAGHVVAMTGDGVNDAPALKTADIGVAMGSGTDVAKEAADMVLLDDNIATLLSAIREGRVLYDNVRKVVAYLMTFSLSEVAVIVFALVANIPVPFLPIHLLFINVVTDGFPAMALAFESAEPGIMRAGARKKDEAVINSNLLALMGAIGAVSVISLLVMEAVLSGWQMPVEVVRTVLFLSLCLDGVIAVFVIRHLRGYAFTRATERNRAFLPAVLASLISVGLVLAIPSLRDIFGLSLLPVIGFVGLFLVLLVKLGLFESLKHLVIPESRGIM
ncbi:MAG: cation-transporting P-type ATPase [Patescibacteria group bacterium]|jgi:Ca2+-transporting ATPase